MATFRETLHEGFEQVLHLSGEPLVDERSEFQHIQIFDTVANGRVMALDGIVQITDKDESAYSEMLTHLPILEHDRMSRALIVGGGDGAVAEEILKHKGIEHIDLVDIDARVVEHCRVHFAHVNNGAFDDPRLDFHAEDAFEFLKRAKSGSYDLVIADRPDPVGPAQSLFAQEFYRLVQRALAERGVLVCQTGCPFLQAEELRDSYERIAAAFANAGAYLTVVPTYSGGFMALTWGSNGLELGSADTNAIAARFAKSGVRADYYNPRIHGAAFALPTWIGRLLAN